MSDERGAVADLAGTTIVLGDTEEARGGLAGVWRVEIFDADGVLQYDEVLQNLITTQGKNHMLTMYTAQTGTAIIMCSAFVSGTPAITATYAVPVVTEIGTASLSNRQVLSFNTAAAGAIVGGSLFNILQNTTITGIMAMSGGSGIITPGNTTAAGGVLFSEGLLGTPQVISTTGTVNLSYTLSV